MSQTNLLRAQPREVASPGFSQAQIDQFVDSHERFLRRQPHGARAIMRFLKAPQANFSGRRLTDADFTGADLKGATFVRTDLERASLYGADLESADLRGANLRRADLRGAGLRLANLNGAILDDADLRPAMLAHGNGRFQLSGRSLSAAKRDGDTDFSVDFSNCSMKSIRFDRAKLKGANFSGAILTGATFRGAQLTDAKFDGAVLIGVDIRELNLQQGQLTNCVMDSSLKSAARGAELAARVQQGESWADTDGAHGQAANLDGEDLRPLSQTFARRRLTAMSAKGACAISVSFAGAQLQGANFDEADLRDADFTGADLRGASFRGALLWHARFNNADIRPLALDRGYRSVDFTGSHYEDEYLDRCLRQA